MSWNIQGLRGDRKGVWESIQAIRPDLLILQEVPRLLWPRLSASRLGERIEMRLAAGGNRASRGNAIFIAPPWSATQARVLTLPRLGGRHRRAAILVRIGDLTVVGWHASMRLREREAHAHLIKSWLDQTRSGLIVAGDFNEEIPGTTLEILSDLVCDPCPSAQGSFGSARIDAILTSPDLALSSYDHLDTRASDHAAVVADFTVTPPK
jgi:endonuclease/exonuclease/phosphatase family metal-dependent hydrolase